MAVNKVVYGGETLVDLTSDTVTANDLAEGVTATAADGTQITGLLPKVEIDSALSSTSTNPVQNKVINTALDNKQAKGNYVTYTANANITAGKFTGTTYTYGQSPMVVSNGIIIGGTAANAGLVTRGICGVTVPDTTTGACTKDKLYINYDGSEDNTYSRTMVLGAGSDGNAITTSTGSSSTPNQKYGAMYTAIRGDQMVNYVTDKLANYKVTVDSELSTTSTNPVQNKVITAALAGASGSGITDTAHYTGASVTPSELFVVIDATADLTLDITNVGAKLKNDQSLTFSAIINSDTTHTLIITGASVITTCSKSEMLALSSGGIWLTIVLSKDDTGELAAIAHFESLQQITANYFIYSDNTCEYFKTAEIETIADNKYKGNTAIAQAILADTKIIGNSAFEGCGSLTSIELPTCTSIGNSAFYYCSSLTSIELPTCTSVGSSAFQSCSSLTSIELPTCTSVGSYAFQSCSSLTSIELPTCTSVGSSAFSNCSKLTSIELLKCTSVGNHVFYNCSKLTSIELLKCTSVGHFAFYNCSKLTSIELLECTSVGNSAFEGCGSLTSIELPTCTSIGSSAFSSCSSLTSIELPTCTSVGSSAFEGCGSLTSIELPTCTSVGSYAFSSCRNLTEIHFAAANQAKIEALSGYSSKFRADYATIYFDL